jgi:hypothetical protein
MRSHERTLAHHDYRINGEVCVLLHTLLGVLFADHLPQGR